MRTLDDLRRECQIKGEAKIDQIPCYIGRAIAHNFSWTHNMPPFQKADVKEKVKAFFKWRKRKEGSPACSFEEILEAILKEGSLLPEQVKLAQEAYVGSDTNFELRSYLGKFYTKIIEVFVSFADVVSAYQAKDFPSVKKHESHFRDLIGEKMLLSNLCGVPKCRLAKLLGHFRKSISELEKVAIKAKKSLKFSNKTTINIQLDAGLTGRKKEKVYFKPDRLENTLSLMMDNSIKSGAEKITLRFFGDYNGSEIRNNFGFSLEDDGNGFKDVTCLTESNSAISLAKEEYGYAIVLVKSKGKACWYRITSSGVSRIESNTDCENTVVTLLLPVDNGSEFVQEVLGKSLDEEKLITELFDRARDETYTQDKKYEIAISEFEEILKWVEDKTDRFSKVKTAQCHHMIGNCYTHMTNLPLVKKHHGIAEKLLTSLAETRKLGQKDVFELQWFYNSVSINYMDSYDYENAEEYLLKSIDRKNVVGEDAVSLAKSQGSLGQLYTFWRRYDKAEEVLLKAVKAMEGELANKTTETAISLSPEKRHELISDVVRDRNYLAMLYIKMGKFNEAEELFQKNLSEIDSSPLQEKKNGEQIWVYYGQTKLYAYWVRKTKSDTEFQKAIKAADHGLSLPRGDFPYPWALLLKFKGCAYRELKKWDDAIACMQKSYTALEAVDSGVLTVISASVRLELAKLYLERCLTGDKELACAELEASIKLIESFKLNSAQNYFKESIGNLKTTIDRLKVSKTDDVMTCLQKVLDKIPY